MRLPGPNSYAIARQIVHLVEGTRHKQRLDSPIYTHINQEKYFNENENENKRSTGIQKTYRTHLRARVVGQRFDLRVGGRAVAVLHAAPGEGLQAPAPRPHRQPRGDGDVLDGVEGAPQVQHPVALRVPGQRVHSGRQKYGEMSILVIS
jgi:hypothetical protein